MMKRRHLGRWQAGALLLCLLGNTLALVAEELDIRRDATVRAIEQVMPSVVNIATESVVPVRNPFEAQRRMFFGQNPSDTLVSLGSGVIIDEAGYLLTNDHVVRGADTIAVQFNSGTNLYYEATVVATDPKRDVALLKIKASPGEKFHAIKLAREDDLLLGETVLALGNPFGLGGTVTRGILSSKSRTMPKDGAPLNIPNWLQTDAPINKGNSGGPLVNLRGELIGINVAVVNEMPNGEPVQGIGFAIPIRLVEEALADILPTEYVKSYWFGARVKVGSYPLVITSVQPKSPAGRAGLRSGDVVLQVEGKVPKNFIDFGSLLATNASSPVSMTIRRGTESSDVQVRMVPEATIFNAEMIQKRLGLTLRSQSGPGSTTFSISDVEKDSPADQAGLQSGMVITAIDGQALPDLTKLAMLLYEKQAGESVHIDVAVLQRAGPFNFWGRGSVDLVPRQS